MKNKEIVHIFHAVFKKREEDYIICDVIMQDADVKKRKHRYGERNVKLRLDTTNPTLLEKAEVLRHKCKFHIVVKYPNIAGAFYDLSIWEVIDLLDDEDMLIRENNGNHLIPVPKMERVSYFNPKGLNKKYSDKDIKISELLEDNFCLKEEKQELESYLQNANEKIQKLTDENNRLKEIISQLTKEANTDVQKNDKI